MTGYGIRLGLGHPTLPVDRLVFESLPSFGVLPMEGPVLMLLFLLAGLNDHNVWWGVWLLEWVFLLFNAS